jgi:hypothetical protein
MGSLLLLICSPGLDYMYTGCDVGNKRVKELDNRTFIYIYLQQGFESCPGHRALRLNRRAFLMPLL